MFYIFSEFKNNILDLLKKMLLEYLKENYKPGELILLQNIQLNISYDNLCHKIKQLVSEGKLVRYMSGVYYLPKKTKSGICFVPNADGVAELKYIHNDKNYYGCYAGHTLANKLGLSDQVPHVKEILSNNTSSNKKVCVGKFSYVIKKPSVSITNENVYAIMLLEILKDIDNLTDTHINSKECLKAYIKKSKLNKATLDDVIRYYPIRTYKAIYDLGLSNVLA